MAARKKKPSPARSRASASARRAAKPKPAKKKAKAVKSAATKKPASSSTAKPAKKAKSGAAKSRGKSPISKAPKKQPATPSRTKAPAKKAPAKKAPAKATLAKSARDREREKAKREKEKEKEKEKQRLLKEREKAKREKEREKALLDKAREKAKREKEREKEKAEKEREKARLDKEREKVKREKEREKAKADKERERLKAQREKEKEKLRKQKEAERERQRKERESQKLAAKKAREQEMARRKAEKEAEKARKLAEREALRQEMLRRKEEERRQKEAEREAYNKAKEAERAKLRAQKEAARRALEGKVARATKRANRIGGLGRGATARVYRPDSIPNQAGTSRREAGLPESKFANLRLPEMRSAVTPVAPAPPPPDEERPPPPPPIPPPEGVEERYSLILERMSKTSDHFQREYQENFDMSWIYHDSALEGVVYTYQELKTAIDPNITVVPDSSLQPVCEEIRRHKAAIDWIRELADKKRVPVNIDVIKKIYLLMHPEEGDLKSVKYRKDIPQHRLYFHEYAAPDKIAYKVRQAIDWLNGPEPKKLKSPVRIAARVHYDLLRVFPFPTDSGKVARLLMNLLLLRSGYPPAIVHSTERQRYYDALKGSLPTIVTMVNDSITNGLQSIEKLLDDYERKGS